MSIIFMDDPSFYNTTQFSTRWTSVLVATVSAASGRFGNPSWHYAGTGYLQRVTLSSALTTGTVAVSFQCSNCSGGVLLVLWDSGSIQLDIRMNSSNQLFVTRNGTTLATSTNVLTNGVWYRLEFKATINSSTGSIEVKVNGVDWIGPTTGLNTQATGNASFNQAGIQSDAINFPTGATADFNDFVVTDTNSPNANFLGDVRCYLRMPNSDSSVAWTQNFGAWPVSTALAIGYTIKDSNNNIQMVTTGGTTGSGSHPTWSTTGGATTTDNTVVWTCLGTGASPGAHNWMAVQETPASDGDESYNSSSTPGQIDLFGLPSLPGGAQGILAVDTVVYARKDDAGTRTIQQQISSSSTTANSSSLGLSTSYQYQDFINQTDPHTSAAWAVAAANAMLVGYDEIA